MTDKQIPAHTPGPWTCSATSHHAHDYRLGIPGGLMPFAKGEGVEYANARLIAAAPDLVAALKEASMALELAGLVPGDEYWQQQGRAAARVARAAIAKATGRPS